MCLVGTVTNVILIDTTSMSYFFIAQLHKHVLFQQEIPLVHLRRQLGSKYSSSFYSIFFTRQKGRCLDQIRGIWVFHLRIISWQVRKIRRHRDIFYRGSMLKSFPLMLQAEISLVIKQKYKKGRSIIIKPRIKGEIIVIKHNKNTNNNIIAAKLSGGETLKGNNLCW